MNASATAFGVREYDTPTAPVSVDLRSIEQGERALSPLEAKSAPKKTTEIDDVVRPRSETGGNVAALTKPTISNASKPLAEWQGYVNRIDGDQIYATLDGVYGDSVVGKRYDAVIPRDEISPDDYGLVRPGAYFRLCIGYTIGRGGSGTQKRQSTIVFRRLPAYRQADIDNAREIAKELIRGIRLE